MNWTALLQSEIKYAYGVTEALMDLVEDDTLEWKPTTGTNWMTMGQLLYHITEACGASIRGFVSGDWGLPEDVDLNAMSAEDMLPPAETMPIVKTVAEARLRLATDKRLALEMVGACSEAELATKKISAPWDPTEMVLGHRLLQMVQHLWQHKGQYSTT